MKVAKYILTVSVLAILIGALFVQYTSWPWIFYFTAILGTLIAVVTFFLIPTSTELRKQVGFDATGLSMLTCTYPSHPFSLHPG